MAKKRISLSDREKMESPIKNTLKEIMSTEKDAKDEAAVDTAKKEAPKKPSKPRLVIASDLTSKVNKVERDGAVIAEETRKLKLGSSTFKVTFDRDEVTKRYAYNLHKDTIGKIDICAKAAGMTKADFVDHILNSVLTDIINKAK